MRKRFEAQLDLGANPISEIKFNHKSRHELPPVLMALQHIFVNKQMNEEVFTLLEEKVYSINNHTGRPGMTLWEIFVLSVVRLTLDVDYDFLLDLANNHNKVRQLLGINTSGFGKQKEYEYQTLHDNLLLLDDELLMKINELIVKHGHAIKKKENGQSEDDKLELEIKTDSYVVETNVHFPTDINLLWDCSRKNLDIIEKLKEKAGHLEGWRESASYRKKVKGAYRKTSEIHRKKGKNFQQRLNSATGLYLEINEKLLTKVKYTLNHPPAADILVILYLQELQGYSELLEKHIDLVRRRIINGEVIPHSEKMFSIFEQHTKWLNKGKAHKQVELGLPVSISTDQYSFIIHHKVMEDQVDKQITIETGKIISDKYPVEDYEHKSISFDRGYFSRLAKEELMKIYSIIVLPKPGKKTKKEEEYESQEEIKQLQKKHTIIESQINALEDRKSVV